VVTARGMAHGQDNETTERVGTDAQATLIGAVVLALLAVSMEIDRVIGHAEAASSSPLLGPWPMWQARLLWWTLLWAVGGLALLTFGRVRGLRVVFSAGWLVILAAATNWLAFDTLLWRIDHGVAPAGVILNLQFGVGLANVAVLAAAAAITRRFAAQVRLWDPTLLSAAHIGLALSAAIGLWLGSLELDRFFAPEAQRVSNPAMARQTALSLYWGAYAIGLVAVGFWRRVPVMRYAGLGLLAVTLAKVLIGDLAHLQYVYRVLSLLATGLLFIVTSIAYARLAKQLDAQPARLADPSGPARGRSGA